MTITTRYSIGDKFRVAGDRWTLTITTITVRASGQVEYQLEWVGNADFRSECMSEAQMDLLGLQRLNSVQ